MKRKSILLILSLLLTLTSAAQELTVKELKVTNDLSASQHRVNDLNGQPCALVKVQLASSNAKFEGNVIQPVKYDAGEYWVYMTEGSKELRIKGDDFVACHVVFSNYGIDKVQTLQTYNLTLLLPQAVATTQMQKLTINYSPADAMVLIDSKLYKGSGCIETELPVGNHDYVIAADGYVTAEGSVKLTDKGPRIINETLAAIVAMQQTIAQQTSDQQTAVQESNNVQLATAAQPASSSSSVSGEAVDTFTVNDVSFNMVRVDGGTFFMGDTSEQGSDATFREKLTHPVRLSTYSIGETEVTQALWQAVMGKNPSKFRGQKLPVENVSWEECQTFISKLNELTGKHFRLPTEAEWEYAARGGSKSRGYKYSGSDDLESVAWYHSNSRKTHIVKTKQPNELGLYDMSGNVWEWCQDWKGAYSSRPQTDPTGPIRGSHRVYRGGCWGSIAKKCRLSNRSDSAPSVRGNIGLRLAL